MAHRPDRVIEAGADATDGGLEVGDLHAALFVDPILHGQHAVGDLVFGEIESLGDVGGLLGELALHFRRHALEGGTHEGKTLLDRRGQGLVALVHALGKGHSGVVDVLHEGRGLLVEASAGLLQLVDAGVCRRALTVDLVSQVGDFDRVDAVPNAEHGRQLDDPVLDLVEDAAFDGFDLLPKLDPQVDLVLFHSQASSLHLMHHHGDVLGQLTLDGGRDGCRQDLSWGCCRACSYRGGTVHAGSSAVVSRPRSGCSFVATKEVSGGLAQLLRHCFAIRWPPYTSATFSESGSFPSRSPGIVSPRCLRVAPDRALRSLG